MTENNNLVRKQEQERVDMVIDVIDKKMSALEAKAGNLKQDIVSLRKTFWEDVTVNLDEMDDIIETHASLRQQAEFLSERERSHGLYKKQWNNLTRLKSSPYFGRIDFLEEGEKQSEKIYIGLFSLRDENDEEFLVYDWRAPVSSIYYDYALGPAKYETMDGDVKGEIELKRQFIIRNGKIQGLFDTGITIGDEMLKEVLSDQADTHMKTIVATIQREQNEIIRHDEKRYLIVQGAAGSGKTSAALQRIAYLLYRDRKKLLAENILLFSPNPMFNSYVSRVLPELGEENMQQGTFYQYLLHRLGHEYKVEDPFTHMEFMLGKNRTEEYHVRKLGVQYKSSLAFKELIDHYVDYLSDEGIQFKSISFRGDILIAKEEIRNYFYQLDKKMTIPNRILVVKDWIMTVLDEYKDKELDKEWVDKEMELLDREDFVKVYHRLQKEKRFSDKTFDDFERERDVLARLIVNRRFKPIKKKVNFLQFLDMDATYLNLFSWAKVQSFLDLPKYWEEISNQTIINVKRRQLPYEDATPFLYLKDRLEGKHIYKGIRHLFIDEAQDYSLFQFAYLMQIFPYSKMTILGDLNQSIFVHSVQNQNVLVSPDVIFHRDDMKKMTLSKSYRSTKQIMNFAEQILPFQSSVEPFNRNGELPTIFLSEDDNGLLQHMIGKIEELVEEGFETIAIICKTQAESQLLYDNIKEKIDVRFIQKETLSYEKGILIIPSYLAKGIEFDAVIIPNASRDVYHEEDERTLFYTVCTRAMHRLYLYSVGSVTPFLNDRTEQLCKIIQI